MYDNAYFVSHNTRLAGLAGSDMLLVRKWLLQILCTKEFFKNEQGEEEEENREDWRRGRRR